MQNRDNKDERECRSRAATLQHFCVGCIVELFISDAKKHGIFELFDAQHKNMVCEYPRSHFVYEVLWNVNFCT